MENFIWRKVSEAEKESIKNEAKRILDHFSSKISKIDARESFLEQGNGTRSEGEPWQTDQEFRSIMFENAPKVEDESIVAEKGAWKNPGK